MTEAEPRPDGAPLPSPAGGRAAAFALRALLDRVLSAAPPRDDRDDVALRTVTGA